MNIVRLNRLALLVLFVSGFLLMSDGSKYYNKFRGEDARIIKARKEVIGEISVCLRYLDSLGFSNEKIWYLRGGKAFINPEDSIREIRKRYKKMNGNKLWDGVVQEVNGYLYQVILYHFYMILSREGIDVRRLRDDKEIEDCVKCKKGVLGSGYDLIDDIGRRDDCIKYFTLIDILKRGDRKNSRLREEVRRLIKGDEYLEFLYDYFYEGGGILYSMKLGEELSRGYCDSGNKVLSRINGMDSVYRDRLLKLEYYEIVKDIVGGIKSKYHDWEYQYKYIGEDIDKREVIEEGFIDKKLRLRDSLYMDLRCEEVREFLRNVFRDEIVRYWGWDEKEKELNRWIIKEILSIDSIKIEMDRRIEEKMRERMEREKGDDREGLLRRIYEKIIGKFRDGRSR